MRDRHNIVVAIVAFTFGFLGILVGIGLTLWARLPDHTVDLLVFTESAFGIGMTVIALFFSLVLVNQVREIDRRFDEKGKDIDQRVEAKLKEFEQQFDKEIKQPFTHAMEVFANNTAIMTEPGSKGRTSKQQATPQHLAASMSMVGLPHITPTEGPGPLIITPPKEDKGK